MVDIKGIVLHKILLKEEGFLDAWSKLKLCYFSTEHSAIYKAINKFYSLHYTLPSFDELEVHNRNPILEVSIIALRSIENIDISLDIATEAVINEYTQEETLKLIDSFVDNITYLEAQEIKNELGQIVLDIEEKTLSSDEIVLMDSIVIETERELLNLMPLGLSNDFDAKTGGMAPAETLLIGGERGHGKSLVCSNLAANQYEQGNTSIYFTIEMRAKEIFDRQMALLADIPVSHISKANLTVEELDKLAVVRANMFKDADELVVEYRKELNFKRFEQKLVSTCELKDDGQLIIVDSPQLTLPMIDLTIQKFKSKHGDNLKLVVIDYLNQIEVANKYAWEVQIETSAKLKSFARKYDIILCAPYQINKEGEARFSKGILDSADIAMTLDKTEGRIDFTSTKTRNMGKFEFACPFNDLTLKIDPTGKDLPEKESNPDTNKKPLKEPKPDIPW